MTTQTVMVQVADRAWTSEAVHSACIMARNSDAEVVLVKMVPVQHLSWLGTELGYRHFNEQDRQELHEYELTLEDYGIPFSVYVMQYTVLAEAVAQAAEHIDAQIVFAQLPESIIPYWHKFRRGMLRRHLARHQHRLFDQAHVSCEPPIEEATLIPQP